MECLLLYPKTDTYIGYPAPYGIDGPTGCLGPGLNIFNPTWPGTCPYVTSVGATKVYPGYTVSDPESAVYDPAGDPYAVNYSSGGGFSNVYPIPDYQAAQVATFFKQHNPPYPYYSALSNNTGDIKLLPDVGALAGSTGGIYNRIGRGIPDVAANGDNIAVCYPDVFHMVSHTENFKLGLYWWGVRSLRRHFSEYTHFRKCYQSSE
jgi:tripeptidyl-peptidase I